MAQLFQAQNGQLFQITDPRLHFWVHTRDPNRYRNYKEETDLPNGYYRWRRKKLVRIPEEWLGRFPTRKTIRQRTDAKSRHKMKKTH